MGGSKKQSKNKSRSRTQDGSPWVMAVAIPCIFPPTAMIVIPFFAAYVITASIDYAAAKKLAAEGWTIQDGLLIQLSEDELKESQHSSKEATKERRANLAEHFTRERWSPITSPLTYLKGVHQRRHAQQENEQQSTIAQVVSPLPSELTPLVESDQLQVSYASVPLSA